MSEEEKPPERRSQSSKPAETEAVTEEVMDEETEFYKPDLRTPPRFKASHTSLVDSDTISSESSSEKASEESGGKFGYGIRLELET